MLYIRCIVIALMLPLFVSASGVEYVVKEIRITGNQKTRPQVIWRAMTFQAGDTLWSHDLEATLRQNQDNVYNLGLFNKVNIRTESEAQELTVIVEVKERWYVFPIPRLSLEERTVTDWLNHPSLYRLVYGMSVDWKNVSGRNDEIWFFGQLGYSRKFDLYYSCPFVFPKQKIGIGFGYSYVNFKEIYYGTSGGYLQRARLDGRPMQISHSAQISFNKRLSPRMGMWGSLSFKWFEPSDSIVQYNKRYLSDDGLRRDYYPTARVSFWRDERDVQAYAWKGFRYTAEVAVSGCPGISTTHFAKGGLSFAHYIPVGRRFNFSYGNRTYWLIGKNVPYFEKQFLGFEQFIRGFERYVVDGSFINVTKAEFKVAIIRRRIVHAGIIPMKKFQDLPTGLFLTAFTDAGYVADNTYNNNDHTLKNKLLLGYGLGINFLSFYDSQFRLEYSFNNLGQRGYFLDARLAIK